MSALLECVPNFSEGRDRAVLEDIAAAIASAPGARELEIDADPHAHRAVITCFAPPEAIVEAAARGDDPAPFEAILREYPNARAVPAALLGLATRELAAGRAEIFYEYRLSPWDYAAGSLIVREAGGLVTSLAGAPLQFREKSSVAAGNPACWPELVRLAAAVKEELR